MSHFDYLEKRKVPIQLWYVRSTLSNPELLCMYLKKFTMRIAIVWINLSDTAMILFG